jgi:DNA-binding MarR family transcriptional regulator
MTRAADAPAQVDTETVARLRLGVLRLARRLRQESGDAITPSQLSVLATVERSGPISLGDLATTEAVQPPSITRIVGVLEDAGLVTRRPDEKDRRSSVVVITGAGRRRLRSIRSNRDAWLACRLGELSPEERSALERVLPVLERLVEDRP